MHWVLDNSTKEFYGSAFAEFETPAGAKKAIDAARKGLKISNRPVRMKLAPHKNGCAAPPRKAKAEFVMKPLSAKPEGCTTVYCDNLSYDIDDAAMHKFMEPCGTIKSIRWLTREGTGEFRGCGEWQSDPWWGT